jgi:hypothetical protein
MTAAAIADARHAPAAVLSLTVVALAKTLVGGDLGGRPTIEPVSVSNAGTRW